MEDDPAFSVTTLRVMRRSPWAARRGALAGALASGRYSTATAQENSRAVFLVSAAGQQHRHAGAQHEAGALGLRRVGELLRQDVAGFQVRHHQHVGAPGDQRCQSFALRRRDRLMALSIANGPSTMPPRI